jgi:hypothetical protein
VPAPSWDHVVLHGTDDRHPRPSLRENPKRSRTSDRACLSAASKGGSPKPWPSSSSTGRVSRRVLRYRSPHARCQYSAMTQRNRAERDGTRRGRAVTLSIGYHAAKWAKTACCLGLCFTRFTVSSPSGVTLQLPNSPPTPIPHPSNHAR